ncbi:MAG: extracellular solute-binding protein [Deltaproteobacteria bacterium]|nr:extracellular solute-binding protein [Deltaproteobacteria bacterium]
MHFRTDLWKLWSVTTAALLLAVPAVDCSAAGAAKTLDEITKKANQEGRIVVQMSEPLRGSTAEANRTMAAGLKKTFGADVKVTIHRARSYPAAVAQVLSEVKAGSPPSWDLMYQTDVIGVPLYQQKSIERFEWSKLFNWVTNEDLTYDKQALIVQTRFIFPARNTNVVKGSDIPKSWDEVVNPKWKGRIATTPYQDMWAQLSEPQQWGEERVLSFVKKLGALEPKLGGIPTLQRMLVSGEVAISAVYASNYLEADKEAGAPDVIFVPKGATNSHGAALLAAWLLSGDGQRFLDDFYKGSSLFKPGTSAAKHAAGRKIAIPHLDWQMKNTLRLQQQYEKILVKR